jgi:tetratricopeptide (TPR) repeat protein
MRFKLSSPAKIAVFIFLIALGVRLIFAWQWHATPYGGSPLLDAASYHGWAQEIAQGHILRTKAFYQSPLYPYLLGALYALVGPSLLAASLMNAVLDAATCSLLSWVAFGIFGPVAALATGLVAAFNKQMIFYTAPPMKEPLGLFLLAIFLLLVFRAFRKKNPAAFFGSGLVLGLAGLVRGNALFLVPAFLGLILGEAFWCRRFQKTVFKNSSLFILGLVIAILPATLHNAMVSHDFVPINYADGFNLYLGHFPEANGISYIFPGNISSDPALEELNITWIASSDTGHSVRPSEVSKYWKKKTLEVLQNDPAHELNLVNNKLKGVWKNTELFDNYDIPFIEKNFSTVLSAPLLGFWSLALLAPFGAIAFARARRKSVVVLLIFAAAYAASLLVFYVTGRYRLPLLIFLLPLAGAAPIGLWNMIRAHEPLRFTRAWLLAAFSFGFCLWPQTGIADLEAYDWAMVGKIEAERGRYPEAIEAIQKALAKDPQGATATAFSKGAYAEEQIGNRSEAENLLRRGMFFYPNDGSLVYEYGRLKAANGELREADTLLKKAIEISPYYFLAYQGRAKLLMKLGNVAEAQKVISEGLAIDPKDPLLISARADIIEGQNQKR